MLKKHLQLRVSSAAVGPAPAFPVRPRSQTRRDLSPRHQLQEGFHQNARKSRQISACLPQNPVRSLDVVGNNGADFCSPPLGQFLREPWGCGGGQGAELDPRRVGFLFTFILLVVKNKKGRKK